jgi:outer membrane protein TolC
MPYFLRPLLFALASLPLWLLAQTTLSLSDAITMSLENNYGIRIAAIDRQVAQAQNTWGNAGALPRLDFTFTGRYFQSGNPASFLRSNQSLSPGLALSWTVFDGFAMFANKARLDLLEETSMGNAALVVETNIQAIMLAYYDALVAREATVVLQEVLDNSKERLVYETFRLEVGATSNFDILQFKNAVISDSTNLVSQQLNLLAASRTLNQLMNAEVGAQWVLTDTLDTNFQPYDVVDLQAKLRDNNQNLRNQYLNQQIRREETRAMEALRYPTLTLNGNLNYTLGQAGLADNSTRQVSAEDFSVGFTLAFTLFDGFNARRQVEVAQLNERIATLTISDLQRSIDNELYQVHDNYDARRRLLSLQTENVENASLNLELANDRFKSGLINTFEFRQVQLQYLSAQLDRLRAVRDLNASQTSLIRLIGGLLREAS